MLSLMAAPLARGQEATTAASLPEIVENYKVLKGQVDDLRDANAALERKVADLQSKLDSANAQLSKPSGNFASAEDLKAVQTALEDESKKRVADNEEVMKELKLIAKASAKGSTVAMAPTHPAPPTTVNDGADGTKMDGSKADGHPMMDAHPTPDGPGFTYIVKPNDTPTKIAKKLFEEKGIKITSDQIMAANPQVKDPKKLFVDEKLFIPAPKGVVDTASK